MDLKTFKQDLIYCCKVAASNGYPLVVQGGNIEVVSGKFMSYGREKIRSRC